MIHTMLPVQYLSVADGRMGEPHKRLMAAVLRTVVDDCRGGTPYRRSLPNSTSIGARGIRKAVAYVASNDRAWPFSFENLCEALGVDAGRLRAEITATQAPACGPE